MNNIEPTIIVAVITVLGGILGKIVDFALKKRLKKSGDFFSLPVVVGILLGLVGGVGLGYFSGTQRQSPPPEEKKIWTFDQDTEGWYPKQDPQDAASDVTWDGKNEALQAKFNFGQIDPKSLSGNDEPRATFIIDNQHDLNWTDYKKLLVDIKNPSTDFLEMTFSVEVNNCFYEFGDYENAPAKDGWTTISFSLTDRKYKTCNSPVVLVAPVIFDDVNRLDLILGTNEKNFITVNGTILIDNIRLQK